MADLNRITTRWAGPAKIAGLLKNPSGDYRKYLDNIRRVGATEFCEDCYSFVTEDHDVCVDWAAFAMTFGLRAFVPEPVRWQLAGGLVSEDAEEWAEVQEWVGEPVRALAERNPGVVVIEVTAEVVDEAPALVRRAPLALPERTLASPSPWSAVVKRFEFAPIKGGTR